MIKGLLTVLLSAILLAACGESRGGTDSDSFGTASAEGGVEAKAKSDGQVDLNNELSNMFNEDIGEKPEDKAEKSDEANGASTTKNENNNEKPSNEESREDEPLIEYNEPDGEWKSIEEAPESEEERRAREEEERRKSEEEEKARLEEEKRKKEEIEEQKRAEEEAQRKAEEASGILYYIEVTAPDNYVNFRTGPGTDHDIIQRIYNGDTMPVFEEVQGGRWLRVEYGGKSGWVAASQVTRL